MVYSSTQPWNNHRPETLVVACSDGRLEQQTDEFLNQHLGIRQYDRFYLPGGPGALASSGFEFIRVDYSRRECRFLIEAHSVHQVILLFHSHSAAGPEEAMCADYRRKLTSYTGEQLRAQQESDALEVSRLVLGWPMELKVFTYRAEVLPDLGVQFIELIPPR